MRKTMHPFLQLALGAALLVATSVLADIEKISVLYIDASPWYIEDSHRGFSGIAVEQANALVSEAGFEAQFVKLPWTRALEYLKLGQLDMILNLSRTPERETYIEFLGVMAQEQTVIVLNHDYPRIKFNTLDDLARHGMMWGIRPNVFYSTEFNERLATDAQFSAHFDIHPKQDSNFDKIRYRRLDGSFADLYSAKYELKEHPERFPYRIVMVPFFPEKPIYIGVSRKLPADKIRKLQDAFDRLNAHNTFKAIVEQWTTK